MASRLYRTTQPLYLCVERVLLARGVGVLGSPTLAALLALYMTGLLLSCTLRALDPRDVQRFVSEAARQAGLKMKVTPHLLRHSFATKFLEKNQGDIATLATILGHANISTTTRYLHPNAQRVQEMVEKL